MLFHWPHLMTFASSTPLQFPSPEQSDPRRWTFPFRSEGILKWRFCRRFRDDSLRRCPCLGRRKRSREKWRRKWRDLGTYENTKNEELWNTTLFFFVTYEWIQCAKVVLHHARKVCQGQTQPIGPFLYYEENKV